MYRRYTDIVGLVLVATAAGIAYEYDLAGATRWFNPYGLNSAVAQTAVFLAVACLFVPAQLRATFLSAFIASGLLIKTVELLTVRVSAHWPFAIPDDLQWLQRYQPTTLFVIELIWWIGAVYAIMRSTMPEGRGRPLLRAVTLWPVLLVALGRYHIIRPSVARISIGKEPICGSTFRRS